MDDVVFFFSLTNFIPAKNKLSSVQNLCRSRKFVPAKSNNLRVYQNVQVVILVSPTKSLTSLKFSKSQKQVSVKCIYMAISVKLIFAKNVKVTNWGLKDFVDLIHVDAKDSLVK